MNPPKCQAEDYIQWLIASPKAASCTQAARVSPGLVAHDAYTRLLERLQPTAEMLWLEVQGLVKKGEGWLVFDDSTLDKLHSKKIELVTRHWSGKHNRVVDGINLLTLLWTDGDIAIPIDWRIFHKETDGLTKNDHMRQMLEIARQRGFSPKCMLWDSWYSTLKNLKMLRDWDWPFFVGLKSNRLVNPDGKGNRPVSELEFDGFCMHTHLKGFGWVYLYKVENKGSKKEARYFVGSEQILSEAEVQQRRENAGQIENYHRGLKQECHVEKCQAQKGVKQRNHIGLAIRAFVRMAAHHYRTGVSPFELKQTIIENAIRLYLKRPFCLLQNSTA